MRRERTRARDGCIDCASCACSSCMFIVGVGAFVLLFLVRWSRKSAHRSPPPSSSRAGPRKPTTRTASSTSPLRQELQSLGLKTLRQRARAHGVGESVMSRLADSEDPKEAVIELLLLTEQQGESPEVVAMRSKLLGLKTSEVHQRAVTCGFAEDQIEDCYDSDSPKDAMIRLILSSRHGMENLQPRPTPALQTKPGPERDQSLARSRERGPPRASCQRAAAARSRGSCQATRA